jgi:hypothetical protein
MYVPLIDQVRAENPQKLAVERFGHVLLESELRVLIHSAGSFEPGFPPEGTPQPEVRSEFIRWLATDPEATALIDPRLITAEMPALYFLGGEITQKVIADGISVQGPLFFRHLKAHSIISLVGSQIHRNFDCSGTLKSRWGHGAR